MMKNIGLSYFLSIYKYNDKRIKTVKSFLIFILELIKQIKVVINNSLMIKKVKNTLSPNKITENITPGKQSQPTLRLQKSFKKKDNCFQNRQSSLQKNLVKTFRKQKQNQQIRQMSLYNNNKVYKKSPNFGKEVSKISLKDDIYKNKQMMTSTSKLKIISDILLKKIQSQPQLIIQEVYERNSHLNQLLSDWQKKQLYSETDKLIYHINQFYTNLLEQVLHKSIYNFQKSLQKYQQTLEYLQAENTELKKSKQAYEKNTEYIKTVNDKIDQYYEKSQWATIFINSFNIFNMDIEAFIKQNLLGNKPQGEETLDYEQFDKSEIKVLKIFSSDNLIQNHVLRKIRSFSHQQTIEQQNQVRHSLCFSK